MTKRWLGLDVGSKTIGVAISDALGLTAQGVTVWRRRGLEADLHYLRELVKTYDVAGLVLGLPRRTDGSLGPEAKEMQGFAEILQENLGVPVKLWDERFTTAAAQRLLLTADASRKRRREIVDKIAATLILQGFLDRHRHEGNTHEKVPEG